MAEHSQIKPPWYRDVRVLRVIGQAVALVAVVGLLYWLINNLLTNLEDKNISTSFDVLNGPTNFQIANDPGFNPRSPIWPNMIWVGVKNTAIASFVGIVIAMVLGTLIGIGRLSTNWIVNKLSMLYIETLRNIPVLVIIIFFGFAVFTFGPLPPFTRESAPDLVNVPGSDNVLLLLRNSTISFPSFAQRSGAGVFWILALVGLLAAAAVWRWRTAINRNTGQPHRRVLLSFLTLAAIVVVAWLVLTPYNWSFPSVETQGPTAGRTVNGGFSTSAAYLSVTIALGLYTASHIAEIIRGSILAVPGGQSEAANALALSSFQRYRFVVLPQAFRTAIPPTINQFLNLTKNTSLATAVAYADITALVKTAIGNGKPAVQLLVVLMLVYLMFSISISIVMNYVNRRFQLVDR